MPPTFDADIDRFAELSAELDDPFADHAAVLHAAGLEHAALVRLQERWATRLEHASDEATHLAQRFSETYERTRQAIEAARRGDDDSEGKRAPDPRFLSAQAQSWREEAAAVSLSVSADASPPVLDSAPPAPFRGDPLPSPPPAAEPPAMPPWVPEGMRRMQEVDKTQNAPENLPVGKALPFDPSATPRLPEKAEERSLMPAGMRGFVDVGGTQLGPGTSTGAVLPFDHSAPPQAPSLAATAPWMPRGMRGVTDLQGTHLVPESLPVAPALPFDPSATPQPSASSAERSAVPKGMLRFTDVGGTQVAPEEPAGADLPFETPLDGTQRLANLSLLLPTKSATAAPVLSLEQHASLCVELDGDPARRPEILQKYRVDEEQARKVEAYWRARLAAEPSLKAAWVRAYTGYQAWLQSTRSPRR